MREANRLKAQYVIILGDNEIKKGLAIVKNMDSGQQEEVSLKKLPNHFMIDSL